MHAVVRQLFLIITADKYLCTVVFADLSVKLTTNAIATAPNDTPVNEYDTSVHLLGTSNAPVGKQRILSGKHSLVPSEL